MVPPDSHGIPRVVVLGYLLAPLFGFAYGAFTLYGVASQLLLLPTHGSLHGGPTTPATFSSK